MASLLPVARTKKQHEYSLCQDPDCPRFPCRVYKEGFTAGRAVGYAEGYGDGYGTGYGDGYAEDYSAGAASSG